MADLGELVVKLSADIRDLQNGLKQAKGELTGLRDYANNFGAALRRALGMAAAFVGVYQGLSLVKRGFTETIKAVDDFQMSTISAAATITDMAEKGGRDVKDIYANALAYARDMYFELQEAAAKYFASGTELVQAWNLLIQKGVVLRKEEIDNLGVVVDKIKLATQGQMGSYQIAQELRAMMDGHVNAASQLAMLLQNMGVDVKNLAAEIRKTQSLAPVAEALSGLKLASKDIEQTFTSAISTLWTTLNRLAVESGGELYRAVVNAVKGIDSWLKSNRLLIQLYISDAWQKIYPVLQTIWQWASQVVRNIGVIFSGVAGVLWNAFGPPIKTIIGVIGQLILWLTNWAAANVTLLGHLAKFYILTRIAAWVMGLGKAIMAAAVAARGLAIAAPAAVAGISGIAGAARAAWVAFGGWAAAIAVVGFELAKLAGKGLAKVKEMAKESPYFAGTAAMGEAWGVMSESDRAKLLAQDEEARKAVSGLTGRGPLTIPEKPPEVPSIKAPTPEAGGGGKGAKEQADEMLRILEEYLEAKRRLEIQEAEESYQTFKATQDKKKAELELALAEGKITGEEYYRALHQMAEDEAAAHLRLIDTKIAKEKEAYEWAVKQVEQRREAGELSHEAAELTLKKLLIDHTIRLKELEGEALRANIEKEKEHLELLRQEVENRKRIADILASGREEAALGPIAEKEAEINRLLRERVKLKEELIRLGATEAQVAEFDRVTKELELNKRFGDQIKAYTDLIAGFFGDLVDAIMSGERDLRASLNKFFRSLFKQALEPAMKQLMQWLTDFFRSLFGSIGSAVLNGIMMIVALVGMFLTSGGSSSWTPAGIQKGVTTSHEAVRGVIAGETSIPIAKIGESLQEALAPHLAVLRQIEINTRGCGGGGGGQGQMEINVKVTGVEEAVRRGLESYFREYLILGAGA